MALTKISTGMLKQDAASSDLNIDAGTLYIDVSNNRVGIANTSPSQALDVTGNVVISGTATATTFVGSGASLTSIPNSALTNSSITINSTATSLGGSITLGTDDVAEGSTNLYYTNARADARIAAASTDDLSEGSSNLYYTDSRVGTYISGNRTFGNITTTGYIAGPATFTIDPAAVGDNTGTVVIAGNLQVDGTTTTINSTTMEVDDLNITLASGAANAAAANGAGITVDGASATLLYASTGDKFVFNKGLDVTGALTATSLVATTADINAGTIDGTVIGGSSAAAITGTTITGTSFVSSGNMTFGDNNRAIFGAGSDLQIYHDGSNSYIDDTATGHLFIRSNGDGIYLRSNTNEEIAHFNVNGSVKAYYDNAEKLATTATGIDVTGTVTADGLTVAGATLLNNGANSTHLTLTGTTNRGLTISTTNTGGQNDSGAIYDAQDTESSGLGSHEFRVGGESKLLIAADGDISFYEDTGTTAKFFWDSSAESLSVGSSSSTTDRRFQVTGSGVSTATSQFGIVNNPTYPTVVTANIFNLYTGPTLTSGTTLNNLYNLYLESNNKTGSTVTNSFGLYQAGSGDKNYFAGNVGIGVTDPDVKFEVSGSARFAQENHAWTFDDNINNRLGFVKKSGNYTVLASGSGTPIIFSTSNNSNLQSSVSTQTLTERMRIDSSGNLLVSKTSTDVGTAGLELRADGLLAATRSGSNVGVFRRLTDDGSIIDFQKDGSTVGSIGTLSSKIYIGSDDTSIFFDSLRDALVPHNSSTNAARGAAIDLGRDIVRFKDLYLSGTANAGAILASNSEFVGSGGVGGISLKATYLGATKFSVQNTGNVSISGALSKGSGSFKIDHPLPAKTATHHLVHSFVESPQADNIYRGKIDLVDGSATVNIDTAAGMTEGTYVLLNTNTQCFTSNESGWTAVKGSVSGNTLTITAQDNTCTDTISWMIVGERQDQHMIDTDWTDDNGKVIVEPLKESN